MKSGKSIVAEKSYNFSLSIIQLYKYLVSQQKEYVLSKQLLRCCTSIGANIQEAYGAYSRKEFAVKMSIAYKEARESEYWLNLLLDSKFIEYCDYQERMDLLKEIIKILYTIVQTASGKK